MSNGSGADNVQDVLAGIVGDLDGVEVELLAQQTALAEQLAGVEDQLSRIAAVRAAAVGAPVRRGPGRPRKAGSSANARRAQENKRRALAYAKAHPDGFTAGAMAEEWDMPAQAVGPVLSGLRRDGAIVARGEGKERSYILAG